MSTKATKSDTTNAGLAVRLVTSLSFVVVVVMALGLLKDPSSGAIGIVLLLTGWLGLAASTAGLLLYVIGATK